MATENKEIKAKRSTTDYVEVPDKKFEDDEEIYGQIGEDYDTMKTTGG